MVLIVSFVTMTSPGDRRCWRPRTGAWREAGSRGFWSTRSSSSWRAGLASFCAGDAMGGPRGHRGPCANRPHLRLRHLRLGWSPRRPVRRRIPRAQPLAGDRGRVQGKRFGCWRAGAPPPLRYPERLGRWPAVAGLIAFLWLELSTGRPVQTVGLTPRTVAIATLVYSALTFTCMALFGTETWLRRGETFSVYFGMFARLSPLEVREAGSALDRSPALAAGLARRRYRSPWSWSRSAGRPSTGRRRARFRGRSGASTG